MMENIITKPLSIWKANLGVPGFQQVPIDVVGSNTFGRFPKMGNSETINMVEIDNALVPFAGYTKLFDLVENGVSRALFNSALGRILIAVVSNGVFVIDSTFGKSRVGSLETFSGAVYIADNQAGQIAIVDGKKVYIYNYNNSTFQVVDPGFNPTYICYQDTYFIAAAGNSPQWRLSANNDGTSWPADAQHVGQNETKPSLVTAVLPLNRPLFVFSETATDIYQDVGYTLFPYQRNNQLYINYGCVAPATIASNDTVIVWLASNEKSGATIMYSTGGAAQQLPTAEGINDGINYAIGQMVRPEKAVGFLFRLDGRLMYQITFPDQLDNKTFVYDFVSRKYFTLTDSKRNHHIAKNIAWFDNDYYFLSFVDGGLYKMDPAINSYNGNEIPRIRICSSFELKNAVRFSFNALVLTMEQGNSIPLQFIDLSLSKDGGQSYGSIYRKKLNTYGARPNIVQWYNLGVGNTITTQLRFWGNGRFVITDAYASVYT